MDMPGKPARAFSSSADSFGDRSPSRLLPKHCYRKTISACLLACLAQCCSRETTQHVQINTQPNMLKRVVAVSIRLLGGLAGPTRRPCLMRVPLTSMLKPFRDHEVAAAVKGS